MSVGKANLTATQVEEQVKKEFDEVTETKVRMEPPSPQSEIEGDMCLVARSALSAWLQEDIDSCLSPSRGA